MSGIGITKSAWGWFFVFFGITLFGALVAFGIKSVPDKKPLKEDVAQQQSHVPATKSTPPKQERSEFLLEAISTKEKMVKTPEQAGFRSRKITSLESNERFVKITYVGSNGKPVTVELTINEDGYYVGSIPNVHPKGKRKELSFHIAPYPTKKEVESMDAISGKKHKIIYLYEGYIGGDMKVYIYKKTYEANLR